WGNDEFWFLLWLWRVNGGCPPDSTSRECTVGLLRSAEMNFSANDGKPFVLNRSIPDPHPGAWVLDASIGPDVGIPVWADQAYGIALVGREEDLFMDDDVGTLFVVLSAEDNWHIGTWTERGVKSRLDNTCPIFPVGCGFQSDQADAHVTYEVRLAPLPDLTPTKIERVSLAGTTNDGVCMDVGNAGPLDAGPFQLVLRVDDTPAPNGILQAGELPAGKIATLCTETNLPTSGSHRLSVAVDEARDVLEQRETNNRLEQPYRIVSAADGSNVFSSGGTGVPASSNVVSAAGGGAATEPRPAASPTPGPSTAPSQARPDLTVSAIRVNGQVPDGKGDCKDGKNAVAIVVKNGGTTNADDFAVSLAADKEQVADKRVPGLEAGQAREIRFDDVRLKKGEHKLTAVADAEKTVAESDEGNNGLTVAARCEDD
ncbi:MAG TPA: CARDB domain-containing protein, partial [Chloroflexota bacterium]|nr:CARDB domain-containing protein [Chloroflexota bacterium]